MQFSITESQLQSLNSLHCQRLSSDENNLREVECFSNAKSQILEDIIKSCAYESDEKGDFAYYLVKSPDGTILCYFSLKTGLLFNKHGDLEILQTKKKLKLLLNKRNELNDAESKLKEDINKEITTIKDTLKEWMELDAQDEIHKRVAQTFSGIEIAHFCVNDNAKNYWDSLHLGDKNPIGVSIFWHFIVPIIQRIKELVGIEYLFLFAADSTEDRSLVNHYKAFMGFDEIPDIFAALPIVDFGCVLLCQSVKNLLISQKRFYDEFNISEDSI